MSENELFVTPLNKIHRDLGAKMVPFGGWDMPVQYTEGIIAEHNHTRNHVSLFDICHMGEFRIKGKGCVEAVETLLARPIADLKVNKCRYNFLLNETGGVIDDLIVYRVDTDELFIVVNAGTRFEDAEVLQSVLTDEMNFSDESDQTAKLDLQGPESADVLASLGLDIASLPNYFSWDMREVAGIPCLLSRTGYTGELGYELYFSVDDAEKMWNTLLADERVKPGGLGARDTLRLEMGYALYGHELNTDTTPVEAGFGPMLKLDAPRSFRADTILRTQPIRKRLVGIEIQGRRAAREGFPIELSGEVVGQVTSGAFSPSLGYAIAMGYINANAGLNVGDAIEINAGRKPLMGKIVDLPFYKGGSVRKKLI